MGNTGLFQNNNFTNIYYKTMANELFLNLQVIFFSATYEINKSQVK